MELQKDNLRYRNRAVVKKDNKKFQETINEWTRRETEEQERTIE